jgi:hypothetical protein
MAITPKMGLTSWPNLDDLFSHVELASNFDKLDAHDHTPGKGAPLTAASIPDGSISAAKLMPGAVTSAKLAADVGSSLKPPVYTYATLPKTANDGDECYFVAKTFDLTTFEGVMWHLRYNTSFSGTSKWQFLGGAPLVGRYTTTATTNIAVTAGGYSVDTVWKLTLPLPGTYNVRFGAVGALLATGSWNLQVLAQGNTSYPAKATTSTAMAPNPTSNQPSTVFATDKFIEIGDQDLRLQVQGNVTSTVVLQQGRFIEVVPIAVSRPTWLP